MMATVVVVSIALIVLFWFFRRRIWKAFREGAPRDENARDLSSGRADAFPVPCTGSADCPRVRRTEAVATDGERTSFSVPESFDEAREYEIVFGRRTTPTSGRRTSTSALFRNLRHCIPISTSN